MKIAYIQNVRIPTERAHGIQIMKMCEALARLGHDVELIVPRRSNLLKENPFNYYGIRKTFKIRKLPCLDLIPLNKYGQIPVDPKNQRTKLDGLWAAGDSTDGLYHQNNIAAGDAVKALEDIYLYIHAK